MKQLLTVKICNQKFEATSFSELQNIIKNDLLLNTWLSDNNQKIAGFYPTRVITKRLFQKEKVDVIEYYFEVDPINYWME